MQQKNLSFWTDIKTFEEQLSRSPESFCFARLSEIYLKVGLVYDALHTARQGVANHPRYLAGLRALALACHADGIKEECISNLKLVAEATPEDREAMMLLGRLLVDCGEREAARKVFCTVLEFVPDDLECRTELKFLEVSNEAALVKQPADSFGEEEIIDDLEIIEDEPDDSGNRQVYDLPDIDQHYIPEPAAESRQDPLSTATLAELYVKQGFVSNALEIYHSILADDPGNSTVAARIDELERPETAHSAIRQEAPESSVLSTLEGWLENIMRLRLCR